MGWCLWPLPEGEGVVSNKGLALSDEEGAVGSPRLDAVLRQQPLCDVPPVASRSQLAVKPLLRGVKLGAVAHLAGRNPPAWVTEGRLGVPVSALLMGLPARTREFLRQLPPFPPQELALKPAGSGEAQPLGQSSPFSRGTTHCHASEPSPPFALPHPHFLGHWLSPQSNRSCCWSGQSNVGSIPARKQTLAQEPS